MKTRNLKISYHDGKPIAAYLTFSSEGVCISDFFDPEQITENFVVDYDAKGQPIGIECLAPDHINLESFNKILTGLSLPLITQSEASEWFVKGE